MLCDVASIFVVRTLIVSQAYAMVLTLIDNTRIHIFIYVYSISCRHFTCSFRLRSHRNIWYTVYGIRYTLFGIQYTLYGHGGSHRSSTRCQWALFVSMKKVAKSVFCTFMRIQIYAFIVQKLFLT